MPVSEDGRRWRLDIPRPSLKTFISAARWWIAATVTVHLGAAVTVMTVDHMRKRRTPLTGEFPRTAPRTMPVADSEVTTFTYGADVFDAMLDSINNAKHTILFETYIWKADEVGHQFKEALIAAARRGVNVYLIWDTFGNLVVDPRFYRMPDLPTLHALRFPLFRGGMLTMNVRKTGLDHRKVLVVDGNVGYVGGYNIGSLYRTQWRDTHVRVEGPSVWELENAFVDFWNDHRKADFPELPDTGAHGWEPRIRAAQNAPSRLLFPVRGLYLEAIDRAESHVYITQAYFIPDREILATLIAAARRGVDVRVLIPEVSNHVLADWAARSYYTRLLEAGVTLWLFKGAMVHAKTMTVDGRWSTIGTTNIDRMSMTGNFEVNLEFYDDELAAQMEHVFKTDLTNARQLTPQEWNDRGRVTRLLEYLTRPFGPLL
ncbi:phosphatidylserine/phosphatidylglycerophosphate/ cardiolipin synthase family protein [Occultella aeris]|uniref:Major cardiolipin synthase ClsA n=1 Tax=Occultella aeris TaxID=2761496 RepID=A0A7M4DNQ7_9MICO|nr:phospholipase D-like domain-containing protein [Occultella aeris]VZO39088.1 Major cardiolipin synthase ClsA [Occultella aeris]